VNPEIPAGLEQRILARARASKKTFTPWLLIAATACALCVVIMLLPKQRQPAPQVNAAMALPRVRSAVDAATAPILGTPRRHALAVQLPKLETFPTAPPVPDPELEIARLSLENPGVAKALLAEPDTGEPKPIQIDPLSIKLLDED
jgi:hypothetical protein